MKKLQIILAMIALLATGSCANVASTASDIAKNCSGMSIDQLKSVNDISDSCKTAIQSLLDSAANNLGSKIFPLGMKKNDTSLDIYAAGINASGNALSSSDFASATINVVTNSVSATLSSGDYSITDAGTWGPGSMSVSYVTDYSGSMNNNDLTLAAEINVAVASALPAGVYGEVYQFASTVKQKLAPSTTQSSITAALAYDSSATRGGTALYDAVGTAAKALATLGAPVKIMLVQTDGLENASTTYTKDTATSAINDNKIVAIMIGTLFADQATLKTLAGTRGAYVYARTFTDAKTVVSKVGTALAQSVRIRISNTYKDATSVTITSGSLTTTFQ